MDKDHVKGDVATARGSVRDAAGGLTSDKAASRPWTREAIGPQRRSAPRTQPFFLRRMKTAVADRDYLVLFVFTGVGVDDGHRVCLPGRPESICHVIVVAKQQATKEVIAAAWARSLPSEAPAVEDQLVTIAVSAKPGMPPVPVGPVGGAVVRAVVTGLLGVEGCHLLDASNFLQQLHRMHRPHSP